MLRSKTTIDITNFLTTKAFLNTVPQSNIILVGRPLETLKETRLCLLQKDTRFVLKRAEKGALTAYSCVFFEALKNVLWLEYKDSVNSGDLLTRNGVVSDLSIQFKWKHPALVVLIT
jgi:hypothetical protein